jgi:hypothetical protein
MLTVSGDSNQSEEMLVQKKQSMGSGLPISQHFLEKLEKNGGQLTGDHSGADKLWMSRFLPSSASCTYKGSNKSLQFNFFSITKRAHQAFKQKKLFSVCSLREGP